MKKIMNRVLSALLICFMLFSVAWVEPVLAARGDNEDEDRITHGTATEWISEDMVNNTPPADYVVNEKTQGKAKDAKYNDFFLEDTLQTVYIEIEENNLNYLLQNADEEPYVMATSVTIGDETLGFCGLKTKGSYTLEHSYTDNPGSDRFSFTVNFGKFIKKKDYGQKQNFYGCDKISFNNFFFDKSMMKEFFALKLMDEMGLPTPQYGLAKLYINGEYYGVYAMVEAMDTSILEQHYGVDSDELSSYLCKPEGTSFLYDFIVDDASPLWENDEDTYKDVEDMIPIAVEWVRKLNCLSEGIDFDGNKVDVNSESYLNLLSQVMDIDEVVKYFAVHSWLCQMDNMFVGYKNFGLYLSPEGICTMIPWDYDLSFGCYYPCNAQSTANYPLDVMYRLDMRNVAREKVISSRTYKDEFPLFNVIYQNDELMDKYHAYMKECSKVVALGGKVESTGREYAPGFFNSFIEIMQEELIAAATEKLADNVYYMNRIKQPSDVKKALPNLSKILALRSVGVFAQVEGIDTEICAYGCNLETLGNAMRGDSPASGVLTVIDAVTGIFATAEYDGKKSSQAPMLTVTVLEESDENYIAVKDEVSCEITDKLIVYKMSSKAKPITEYTLTIPMSKVDMNAGKIRIYSYTDGKLEEIETTKDDNLFTGTTESIEYIAVLVKASGGIDGLNGTTIGIIAAVAGVAVLGVVVVLVLKRKNNKKVSE